MRKARSDGWKHVCCDDEAKKCGVENEAEMV